MDLGVGCWCGFGLLTDGDDGSVGGDAPGAVGRVERHVRGGDFGGRVVKHELDARALSGIKLVVIALQILATFAVKLGDGGTASPCGKGTIYCHISTADDGNVFANTFRRRQKIKTACRKLLARDSKAVGFVRAARPNYVVVLLAEVGDLAEVNGCVLADGHTHADKHRFQLGNRRFVEAKGRDSVIHHSAEVAFALGQRDVVTPKPQIERRRQTGSTSADDEDIQRVWVRGNEFGLLAFGLGKGGQVSAGDGALNAIETRRAAAFVQDATWLAIQVVGADPAGDGGKRIVLEQLARGGLAVAGLDKCHNLADVGTGGTAITRRARAADTFCKFFCHTLQVYAIIKDMARVIAFADIHGDTHNLLKIAAAIEASDGALFLGDGISSLEILSKEAMEKLVVVRGNCDLFSKFPPDQILEICGRTFFITHGHAYGVKDSLVRLVDVAKQSGANVCMYAHRHEYNYELRDGIHFVGLPALGASRARGGAGYVEVNLDGKKIDFVLKKI